MKLKTCVFGVIGFFCFQVHAVTYQEMSVFLLFNHTTGIPQEGTVEYYLVGDIAKVLEKNLDQEELDALYEEFNQEYFVHFMDAFFAYTGGPYRFTLGLLNFLSEQFGQLKDSNEGLKVQYWLQEKALQQFAQHDDRADYIQEIYDWYIDYDAVARIVYKRQFECLFAKRDYVFDQFGIDEKSLVAGKMYYELALKQYIFMNKMMLDFKGMAYHSFKEQVQKSDMTSYDIIKMQRFIHSDLGVLFKKIHVECMQIASQATASSLQF
jgi:hypothetical protein